MFRQALVEECIVCREQLEHAAIFAQNAVHETLCFLPERLPQVIVKIRIQTRIRREGIQIA